MTAIGTVGGWDVRTLERECKDGTRMLIEPNQDLYRLTVIPPRLSVQEATDAGMARTAGYPSMMAALTDAVKFAASYGGWK